MMLELRPLAADDLEEVARLYAETFNRPPWNDGWTEEAALERLSRYLDHPDSLGVVAIRDGRVHRFALGMAERWVDGEYFHLKEMCTDPSAQRTGIGDRVLEELSTRSLWPMALQPPSNSVREGVGRDA